MQEEIEQKSFNIMISTTKLSARTVLRAVKAAFRLYQSKTSQGKQSVRTLLRQNRGVSSVEISKTGIRGLERYAKKYGIDYAIRYATDAICWTQVPERLRDLCKQRKRWHLGLFQSMYKHRVMFSNHRFGAVSFVSYLYFLIYELLSPFIEVFGVFTMVLAWWCDLINVPFMLLFFLIYAVFGGVLTLTAFFSRIYTADLTLSFGDGLKAVCLCLFELVFLRFILAWVRCTAFIGYKKKKLSWGRIERRKIDLK